VDPLTHTLVGANLASTRLGQSTRYGAAALLIGANLPDIDVLAYLWGEDVAIGFRRGWTHGITALILLPFLLTALLMLWHRVVGTRSQGPTTPPRPGWLLLASAIGVMTHPFLDWLNNYGMRWLMPFDGTWFYGDSVFIMDPWLWLILGAMWLLPRPPTRSLLITWAVLSALLALVVAQRAPLHLITVAIIAILLLLALLRPPGSEPLLRQQRFGIAALLLASLFIAGMISIHALTIPRAREALQRTQAPDAELLMVAPMPINPLRKDVLVRSGEHYRYGVYDWIGGALRLSPAELRLPDDSPLWREASTSPEVSGFMSWTRFPWYHVETAHDHVRVFILDARYSRSVTTGFGGAVVELPVGDGER
jgi:inner membrane protein